MKRIITRKFGKDLQESEKSNSLPAGSQLLLTAQFIGKIGLRRAQNELPVFSGGEFSPENTGNQSVSPGKRFIQFVS